MTSKAFLRMSAVWALSIALSLALSVYWGDKRWLVIAVLAMGAVMISFCVFILDMASGQESIERPRAFTAFVVIVIGIYGGLLIPLIGLYMLFR